MNFKCGKHRVGYPLPTENPFSLVANNIQGAKLDIIQIGLLEIYFRRKKFNLCGLCTFRKSDYYMLMRFDGVVADDV